MVSLVTAFVLCTTPVVAVDALLLLVLLTAFCG